MSLVVFPVVMYRCESWTMKKAEHQRFDAFELWGWRRLLRVLWTTRISHQSILKELNPEYSLQGLMLKLTQSAGHLKIWLMGKDPDVGKDWEQKENGGTENEIIGWHHWPNGHEFQQTQEGSKGQGRLVCCSPWCLKGLDTTEWLNNMPALQLCVLDQRGRSKLEVTCYSFSTFLAVDHTAYKDAFFGPDTVCGISM